MLNEYLANLDCDTLLSMLYDQDKTMSKFNKDEYDGAFHDYFEKYKDVYNRIEEDYQNSSDPAAYLDALAQFYIDSHAEKLELQKKGKRDGFQIDQNMVLVTYYLPSFLEYRGTFQDEYVKLFVEKWNREFKQHINVGSFESINQGFKRKLCYVTTAVCETLGKPLDCYELTLLKTYRDGYLTAQPEGEALIHEYYNIAPTIVNRINKVTDSEEIYKKIYKQYISPCITLIEQGKNDECKELYVEMVKGLQSDYMLN